MKKRMLCFILALIMVLPLVLVSCNSQSEADRMKEIILGTEGDETERAYTLSLWIPTNKITIEGVTADLSELSQKDRKALQKNNPDIYEFLVRVDAVEDALNKLLVSRNYYTHIDIVPVNDKYYEKSIDDRFDSMSAVSKPGDMNQRGDNDEYKNDVTEEIVGSSTLYKLLYRPVDKNQLDLFLIRSYDKYVSYINSNYIIPLNNLTATDATDDCAGWQATNYITSTGKYYGIYKFIRKEFLDQMRYGEKDYIYALPNNHLFAEDYQYILLNKELLDKYEGTIDLANAESYDDLLTQIKDFVEFSSTQTDLEGNSYQGLVASQTDAPSYLFSNEDLMIGGTVGSETLNYIYKDKDYTSYLSLYKELQSKGLASDSLTSGSTAVQIITANSNEIKDYEDQYEIIVSRNPVAKQDQIYSSMFAISTFSLDYDRSMKMLYLLQTDSEIRTLIQYGIENEDYVIITEKDEKGKEIETISLRDTAYNGAFEVKYTGNSYYTYPGNNTQIDDWDYEKATNLVASVGQYFKFDEYLASNPNVSEEEKAVLSKKLEIIELVKQVDAQILDLSYDEYLAFIEVFSYNILEKLDRMEDIPAEISKYQVTYDENMKYINDNQPILDQKLPNKENYQNKINELKEQEAYYDFDKRMRPINTAIDDLEYSKSDLEGSDDPEDIALLEEIEKELAQKKAELAELIELKNSFTEEELTEIRAGIKKELDEYEPLLNEITQLESNIFSAKSRLASAKVEIDNLNEELNVTIPNQLKEWQEKSPAAFELKQSKDFVDFMDIYKKYYDILQEEKNKA